MKLKFWLHSVIKFFLITFIMVDILIVINYFLREFGEPVKLRISIGLV